MGIAGGGASVTAQHACPSNDGEAQMALHGFEIAIGDRIEPLDGRGLEAAKLGDPNRTIDDDHFM